jgi:uncharacterized protein YjbJ (UPF0337 family)
MNKDQVKGTAKDVAGRVERKVGEWTGDTEKQVHGAAKQVEGKVQKTYGDVKDAGEKAANEHRKAEDRETARREEEKKKSRDAA